MIGNDLEDSIDDIGDEVIMTTMKTHGITKKSIVYIMMMLADC